MDNIDVRFIINSKMFIPTTTTTIIESTPIGYHGINAVPHYDSPYDTNLFVPGTQPGFCNYGGINAVPHYDSPYDTNPYVAGTQPGVGYGGLINAVPHYDSPYDTNPYVAGTQPGGIGYVGIGGPTTVTTTTYTSHSTGYSAYYWETDLFMKVHFNIQNARIIYYEFIYDRNHQIILNIL